MKKIPLLAACLFILLLCLPGYANDPHFRHYNNKQGLSHNTVYCSLQDQRGFMWFGTEDGLNRFDGHTFKNIQAQFIQPEQPAQRLYRQPF